jgi:hypothetical protein
MEGDSTDSFFARALFMGRQQGRIRRLSGFRKGHRLPEGFSDAAASFVARVGEQELKESIDRLYLLVREGFGFRRNQMEYGVEPGMAVLRTPLFSAALMLGQDALCCSDYCMAFELRCVQAGACLSEAAFFRVFNPMCDALKMEIPGLMNLEALVDRLEQEDRIRAFLDYAPDMSQVRLKLPSLLIEMGEVEWVFRLPGGRRDLRALLESSLAATNLFLRPGMSGGEETAPRAGKDDWDRCLQSAS